MSSLVISGPKYRQRKSEFRQQSPTPPTYTNTGCVPDHGGICREKDWNGQSTPGKPGTERQTMAAEYEHLGD